MVNSNLAFIYQLYLLFVVVLACLFGCLADKCAHRRCLVASGKCLVVPGRCPEMCERCLVSSVQSGHVTCATRHVIHATSQQCAPPCLRFLRCLRLYLAEVEVVQTKTCASETSALWAINTNIMSNLHDSHLNFSLSLFFMCINEFLDG